MHLPACARPKREAKIFQTRSFAGGMSVSSMDRQHHGPNSSAGVSEISEFLASNMETCWCVHCFQSFHIGFRWGAKAMDFVELIKFSIDKRFQ